MTNSIKRLQERTPRGYQLFKYYDNDDEPRDFAAPDILDRLYEKYDRINERYRETLPFGYSKSQLLDRLEKELDAIDDKIDLLNNDNGTYYFMDTDTLDIIPISEDRRTVQTIDVIDGKLVYKDTDRAVNVYIFDDHGKIQYVPASDEDEVMPDGQRIFYFGYSISDFFLVRKYYIGSETYKHPDGAWVYKCKDCGRISILNDSQRRWFECKGLQLPKRCYECRQKRKDSWEPLSN